MVRLGARKSKAKNCKEIGKKLLAGKNLRLERRVL
jgi:hypothetical protein